MVHPLFDSIGQLKSRLLAEINKDHPDTTTLLSCNRQLLKLESDVRAEAILFMTRLDSLCTPVQKKKLREIFSRMINETTPAPHQRHRNKWRQTKDSVPNGEN